MREVSNFHRRNLIETGGAPEFWTAKKATRMIIKKATQKEIFIVPDSFPYVGKRNGEFPFSSISNGRGNRIDILGQASAPSNGRNLNLCYHRFRRNIRYY
jgi:hypothetical protein